MKISFKKQPKETGLAGVGYPHPQVDIKIDKKVMGTIFPPTWQTKDNKWSIGFCVLKDKPDDNPNCNWKLITLKNRFDTEEECRNFVTKNIEEFSKKYTFYFAEERI